MDIGTISIVLMVGLLALLAGCGFLILDVIMVADGYQNLLHDLPVVLLVQLAEFLEEFPVTRKEVLVSPDKAK